MRAICKVVKLIDVCRIDIYTKSCWCSDLVGSKDDYSKKSR